MKSEGRQQKFSAPTTAARLIGCGGRPAAAAAAVVGTHDVEFFFAILPLRTNSIPAALLRGIPGSFFV